MTEDHRGYRELLGAYVLGHLDGAEEAELRNHLEGCDECRAEEAELRQVVALLPEEPFDELAPETTPPPGLEDRTVAAATEGSTARHRAPHRSGRLRRGLTLAGAAVAVVALGLAAVLAGLPGTDEEPGLGDVEPVSFSGAPEDVSVDGSVIAHTWGTEVVLEMEGLEEGETYAVTIETESGESVPAGTFIGDADIPVECELNGAVLREDASAVIATDDDGNVVFRSELEPR